jgi:hypothetical protein
MVAAIAAFMMSDRQISAGIHPHPATSTFRTPELDVSQNYLPARLLFMARLLWQVQIGQPIQKSVLHQLILRRCSSTFTKNNRSTCENAPAAPTRPDLGLTLSIGCPESRIEADIRPNAPPEAFPLMLALPTAADRTALTSENIKEPKSLRQTRSQGLAQALRTPDLGPTRLRYPRRLDLTRSRPKPPTNGHFTARPSRRWALFTFPAT